MNNAAAPLWFYVGVIAVTVVIIVMAARALKALRRDAVRAAVMRTIRGKHQPSVTVLLYARNQADQLEPTLKWLRNQAYHHYDIMIIDDASTDTTRQVMQSLKYPSSLHVETLHRRRQSTRATALRAGYRKSRHGELVMIVRAGQLGDRQTIKRAVAGWVIGERHTVTRRSLPMQLQLSTIGVWLGALLVRTKSEVAVFEATSWPPRLSARLPSPQLREYTLVMVAGIVLLLMVFLTLDSPLLWYAWLLLMMYGGAVLWLEKGISLRDRLIGTLALPSAFVFIPVSYTVHAMSLLHRKK